MIKVNNKTRLAVSLALVAAGIIMLAYGLAAHRLKVLKFGVDKAKALSPQSHLELSERDIIRDVTISGLVLNGSVIQRTYGGDAVPASLCPT